MGTALTWQAARASGIGSWEPFWLGDDSRQLYASLHRSVMPGPRLAVVLAAPLFHEQPRSRRLLAEVASGLAAMGLPCLRFDYFGTGDSAGDSDQMDFLSVGIDMTLAMQALRARTGVARVAVLAWRGAALPVARWLEAGARPATLVLWEPVLDGAGWLRELDAADAAERTSTSRYRMRGMGTPGNPAELMGVAVSPRLRGDLAAARLDDGADWSGVPCWAVLRPATAANICLERTFFLPPDCPTFGDSVRMDSGLFVTPALKNVSDELGRALLEVC